jgi:hypothetical protein
VAIDMFVVTTATFQLLYTLIVLGLDRRRVVHFEVTANPTQDWLSGQITEAFHRIGPPRMSGSRYHPERAPLAPRAVELFSLSS